MTTKLRRFYYGFNTKSYEDEGVGFDVYNVECVERDILNAIFTVKGERVMMPEYGTRIPLMTFELSDQDSIDVIREDLETVFDQEPRVEVVNLDILSSTEKNALVVIAKLTYLEFQVTKDLYIEVASQ